MEKRKYLYDVTFIGTYEKERFEILEYLSQNDIKVTIFGNGWDNIKSNKNLLIQKNAIYGEKFYKTIFASKINMGFLRKDNQDVYNSKTVEILSS